MKTKCITQLTGEGGQSSIKKSVSLWTCSEHQVKEHSEEFNMQRKKIRGVVKSQRDTEKFLRSTLRSIIWKREKVENRVLYFRGQNECFTGG